MTLIWGGTRSVNQCYSWCALFGSPTRAFAQWWRVTVLLFPTPFARYCAAPKPWADSHGGFSRSQVTLTRNHSPQQYSVFTGLTRVWWNCLSLFSNVSSPSFHCRASLFCRTNRYVPVALSLLAIVGSRSLAASALSSDRRRKQV